MAAAERALCFGRCEARSAKVSVNVRVVGESVGSERTAESDLSARIWSAVSAEGTLVGSARSGLTKRARGLPRRLARSSARSRSWGR